MVVAIAVAAFAFTASGGSARRGHSGAEARTLSAGNLVAPLDRGSRNRTVLVDEVQDRQRLVSRASQRQAMADAARRRPATREHGRKAKGAQAKPASGAGKRAGRSAQDAWQLPVTKGVYHLTARFGSCSGLWAHCHTGLDFAAPSGTPIHAVANGTITKTGWAGAYGNRTVERLPDGTALWYAHQSAFGVRPGQKVVAGQEIGRVGATGNVTGPHVHLEVRPGVNHPVDPYRVLVTHGLHP